MRKNSISCHWRRRDSSAEFIQHGRRAPRNDNYKTVSTPGDRKGLNDLLSEAAEESARIENALRIELALELTHERQRGGRRAPNVD